MAVQIGALKRPDACMAVFDYLSSVGRLTVD